MEARRTESSVTPAHGLEHSSPADPDLMVRVAAGDEAALATVYDRHVDTVYGSLVRFLGDRQAAEEIAQDTFVLAWRHAARFDAGQGNLAGWLLRIARNRAIDRLRAAARRPAVIGLAGFGDDPGAPEGGSGAGQAGLRVVGLAAGSPAPDPEEHAAREWSRAVVRTALAAMPPAERQALELAYDEELSQTEIAARLGWPLGTVKSRTRRALAALRTALEGVPGLAAPDEAVMLMGPANGGSPARGGHDAAR